MELPPTQMQASSTPEQINVVITPANASALGPQETQPQEKIGERIIRLVQTFEVEGLTLPRLSPGRTKVKAELQRDPLQSDSDLAARIGKTPAAVNVAKYALFHQLVGALPEDKITEELRSYRGGKVFNAVSLARSLGRELSERGIDPLSVLCSSQQALFTLLHDNPGLRLKEIATQQGRQTPSVSRSLRSIISSFRSHMLVTEAPSVADEIMGILRTRMIADLAGRLGVEATTVLDFFNNGKAPETQNIFEPLLGILNFTEDQEFRLRTRYEDEVGDQ